MSNDTKTVRIPPCPPGCSYDPHDLELYRKGLIDERKLIEWTEKFSRISKEKKQ
jgi:hypothetical protein